MSEAQRPTTTDGRKYQTLDTEPFSFKRRWVAAVVAIVTVVGVVVEVVNGGGTDVSHGVLVAIVGGIAAKFLGSKRDDADEDAQGGHPAVRFLFQAANAGEFEGAEDIVDPEFRAYAFGYPLGTVEVDRGPALLVESLEYWREAIPDTRWELYDEVTQREPELTDGIAIRFVHTGTIDGVEREVEGAAFLKVVDKKLTELRYVLDMTVFNEHRRFVGLDPLE